MADLDAVIDRFIGADPIVGEQALVDLVAAGEDGEAAFFADSRGYPGLRHQQRRWLRYVATREATIAGRLIEIVDTDHGSFNRHSAARMFAGIRNADAVQNLLYPILEASFEPKALHHDYSRTSDVAVAWGAAGGSAATLWHLVSKSDYGWEKVRTFAFRGACIAYARFDDRGAWALEQFITHAKYDDDDGSVPIDPDARITGHAIDAEEMWLQAYQPFANWKRGVVADDILRNWSVHAHWRVRKFGAQILAALGFGRTIGPVADWLNREPLETVRSSLLGALEASDTEAGADIILDYVKQKGWGSASDAASRAIWRAGDRKAAIRLLQATDGDEIEMWESAVCLARLGEAHRKLPKMLQSSNYYARANAAIAYGYLADTKKRGQLVSMLREAANRDEEAYLSAALAMLDEPGAAANLHRAISTDINGMAPFDVDPTRLKHHLRDAFLAGFAAAGESGRAFLEAWQAELNPLDTIARPVVLPPKAQVVANDAAIRVDGPGPKAGMKGGAFPQGHALVIGVAGYRHCSPLPETVLDDAKDIASVLLSADHCGYPPGNVEILLDQAATADAIRQGLKRLAERTGDNETAIVFFSGHGGRVATGPDAGVYLIPVDGYPAALRNTAIDSEALTACFHAIKASRLVVLLDACHAGGAGELKSIAPASQVKSGLDENTVDQLAQGRGRVIISSSREDEVSRVLAGMSNSLFTHYLLEALRGECRSDGDGLVKVFDLFDHVSAEVPRRAHQTPILKAHAVESNFPVALLAGGKGVSPAGGQVAGRSAPKPALDGKTRVLLTQRLADRWSDLAMFLEIPYPDQAKFPKGEEPRYILNWLEQRGKLGELDGTFEHLNWNDLTAILRPR